MSKRRLAAMSKTGQKVPTRAVVIFAYDGAQLIDIAGPTQALTTANEEGASPPYAVRLAAISSGPIRTASGVKLIADPLRSEERRVGNDRRWRWSPKHE